ncbi:MAG: Calcineurin-like phosphoesterase superfamily domain protein [Candidatus Latescibacteria bacterium ADurb.Bin168]|nr:MAG: Calcineurin-like phosphoesterase superfamily domain protein [Candidatus Latescibacteria bacterium ADurb.Bin168]
MQTRGSRRATATDPSAVKRAGDKDPKRPPAPERPAAGEIRPNRRDVFRVVAFSDCRAQSLDTVVEWLRQQKNRPDLAIYCGDDCSRFRPNRGTNFFEKIAKETRFGLAAVLGNDDDSSLRSSISGRKVFEVHSAPVKLGPLNLVGSEGAPKRPDVLPIGRLCYTEDQIERHLRTVLGRVEPGPIVIVSHSPPFGVLDWGVRFGAGNKGSIALRAGMKRTPTTKLVFCGHVHRMGGRAEVLDNALVVNAASHDSETEPIRLADVHLSNIERPQHDIVVQWHYLYPLADLRSICDIGVKAAERLTSAGITCVRDLASVAPQKLSQILGMQPNAVARFILLAKARITCNMIPRERFPSPPLPRIFLDIETDPSPKNDRYVWLIGCLEEPTGKFTQFLARTPNEMPKILRRFAKYCGTNAKAKFLAYSGSNFDRNKLVLHMKNARIAVPSSLERCVDLLHPIKRAVAVSTPSYRLKELAQAFGYVLRHDYLDGLQAAGCYENAFQNGRAVPGFLLEYNEDDVRALAHVVGRVEKITEGCAATEDGG